MVNVMIILRRNCVPIFIPNNREYFEIQPKTISANQRSAKIPLFSKWYPFAVYRSVTNLFPRNSHILLVLPIGSELTPITIYHQNRLLKGFPMVVKLFRSDEVVKNNSAKTETAIGVHWCLTSPIFQYGNILILQVAPLVALQHTLGINAYITIRLHFLKLYLPENRTLKLPQI